MLKRNTWVALAITSALITTASRAEMTKVGSFDLIANVVEPAGLTVTIDKEFTMEKGKGGTEETLGHITRVGGATTAYLSSNFERLTPSGGVAVPLFDADGVQRAALSLKPDATATAVADKTDTISFSIGENETVGLIVDSFAGNKAQTVGKFRGTVDFGTMVD
ncbi:hypothetical protein B1H39_24655 [Serratia marcescens]|uniref:hypothetical protein n=1 Tax=Serratia marcescens TaxID=615 RepID=UPI0009A4C511|nr:hypothetical protein [Serratia marcescens]OPJ90704.1 hypothetical protein B1H39_24655 [Serratia marcescens]